MMGIRGSLIFLLLLQILCFLLFPQPLQSQGNHFSRQPAAPLILTHNDRSHSDPQQVHISLAGKDHMRVSWITDDEQVQSVVEYGTEAGKYSAKSTGEKNRYRYFLYRSGSIHHVKIGPLRPNTNYFYRCGGSGPEFSFKTPPAELPIEFVVVGKLLFLLPLRTLLRFCPANRHRLGLRVNEESRDDTGKLVRDTPRASGIFFGQLGIKETIFSDLGISIVLAGLIYNFKKSTLFVGQSFEGFTVIHVS